jgi:hypothetical protein
MTISSTFREATWYRTPIRELALQITGTPLEPLIRQFEQEVKNAGLTALAPRFHLSTEWGVPFGSITIGIPFYLAKPELTTLHEEEIGHIEGAGAQDILRYLRHEMGHVVNYAYRLYEREDWVKHFGSITQPYEEDYRPEPFSPNFVWHLPGWYAQKHPDEDFAETFAVWMTPGSTWQRDYRDSPGALAKLQYCDQLMEQLGKQPPVAAVHELDEDVGELSYSLEQYYQRMTQAASDSLPGLDGALRAIFLDPNEPGVGETTVMEGKPPRASAAKLIQRLERSLLRDIFRWTGHFPERTKILTRQLIARADELKQGYQPECEGEIIVSLTIYLTSLAMNFVHHGSYVPVQRTKERPKEPRPK